MSHATTTDTYITATTDTTAWATGVDYNTLTTTDATYTDWDSATTDANATWIHRYTDGTVTPVAWPLEPVIEKIEFVWPEYKPEPKPNYKVNKDGWDRPPSYKKASKKQ